MPTLERPCNSQMRGKHITAHSRNITYSDSWKSWHHTQACILKMPLLHTCKTEGNLGAIERTVPILIALKLIIFFLPLSYIELQGMVICRWVDEGTIRWVYYKLDTRNVNLIITGQIKHSQYASRVCGQIYYVQF